jgi:aminopeptidase N
VNDDEKWRSILTGLNTDFWHQTVTTQQVEDYISQKSGIDLSKVFDQYLRTTKIPVFEYRIEGSKVTYRWSNVVPGFAMPVRVAIDGKMVELKPVEADQTYNAPGPVKTVEVDRNYYVQSTMMN